MTGLDSFLAEAREATDAALHAWLPPSDAEPKTLHEAMRYSLFAGGKRLRPALALAACRAVGGRDEEVMSSCCALEMVHTYSLIHDDLPSLDDDDLRRGQPTCHVRFGVSTAILAGDALQTRAFELLASRTPRTASVPALVAELARAAGTNGMVGGEVADLLAEGSEPDAATVAHIHRRKTAALFGASAAMGALCAGASEPVTVSLRNYGLSLGQSFQIVDDILDETGDAATLGKSPGKDRRARKMTYPSVFGLEASARKAREFADLALSEIADLKDTQLLRDMTQFVVNRVT